MFQKMVLLPFADCHCTDSVILNFVYSGIYLLLWHFYFNFIHCDLKNKWGVCFGNTTFIMCIYIYIYIYIYIFFFCINYSLYLRRVFCYMIDSHLAFNLLNWSHVLASSFSLLWSSISMPFSWIKIVRFEKTMKNCFSQIQLHK